MWRRDFTSEALMEHWLVAVDLWGGTPEATFRGLLEIERMKEQQTILSVCYTWCMLHSA